MAEEFTLKEMVQEIRTDNKDILSRLTSLETTMAGVHTQVLKTNGRVTALEKSETVVTTKVSIASTFIASVFAGIISYVVRSHS